MTEKIASWISSTAQWVAMGYVAVTGEAPLWVRWICVVYLSLLGLWASFKAVE